MKCLLVLTVLCVLHFGKSQYYQGVPSYLNGIDSDYISVDPDFEDSYRPRGYESYYGQHDNDRSLHVKKIRVRPVEDEDAYGQYNYGGKYGANSYQDDGEESGGWPSFGGLTANNLQRPYRPWGQEDPFKKKNVFNIFDSLGNLKNSVKNTFSSLWKPIFGGGAPEEPEEGMRLYRQ